MSKRKVPKSVQEWKWNPDWTKDEDLKNDYRNNPIATNELLYNIGWTLVPLYESFETGNIVMFSAMCTAKEMWDAVNYARLWTEENHEEFDSYLQEALGHLADAFFMIESMWAWKVTKRTAMSSVSNSIKLALNRIRTTITGLDWYIYNIYKEEPHGNEGGGKQ